MYIDLCLVCETVAVSAAVAGSPVDCSIGNFHFHQCTVFLAENKAQTSVVVLHSFVGRILAVVAVGRSCFGSIVVVGTVGVAVGKQAVQPLGTVELFHSIGTVNFGRR